MKIKSVGELRNRVPCDVTEKREKKVRRITVEGGKLRSTCSQKPGSRDEKEKRTRDREIYIYIYGKRKREKEREKETM